MGRKRSYPAAFRQQHGRSGQIRSHANRFRQSNFSLNRLPKQSVPGCVKQTAMKAVEKMD